MEIISNNTASNHLRRMPQSPLFQICSYPNTKIDWHRSVIGEVTQLTLWWLRMRVIKKWDGGYRPSSSSNTRYLHLSSAVFLWSSCDSANVKCSLNGCSTSRMPANPPKNLDLTMAPGWLDSVLLSCRLEICQKLHTTRFLNQKFYTSKTHISGLFSRTVNQHKCVNISYLVLFLLKFILMCKISTVSEKSHTRCVWNYKI